MRKAIALATLTILGWVSAERYSPQTKHPSLARFEYVQSQMGTQFRIVCYAAQEESAERATAAAFHRIAKLNDTMSDYAPNSELRQLCAQAGGPAMDVSEDLFHVLRLSQELAVLSDGAFDVTAGPVVQLWRRARRQRALPDPIRLQRALNLVGYSDLVLDTGHRRVTLSKQGMQLDLGGIAKGYAADEALRTLHMHGMDRALVAAGGDIVVGAPPPGKSGWKIGIAPLETPERGPKVFLELHNAAVSTSGDAEQYLEIQGQRYSHIVDPRTGMAVPGRSSVTVVAERGADSDPLATAVSVLGPGEGIRLVDSRRDAACWIQVEEGNKIRAFSSKRWTQIKKVN
ncbi:MAG: FAD:protein FMN transferase [Acidobacteriota bacterium]